MTAAWLFVAFLTGAATWPVLRAFVNRAADLTSPVEDESLVAAFFADLAVTEQELDEERERADALAGALAAAMSSGAFPDGTASALRAYNDARAAEVQR